MTNATNMEALVHNYHDFDIGKQQQHFTRYKTELRVNSPVERYSYALMRAALNVFVNHNFAESLNCLAFDKDTFAEEVKEFVVHQWPFYLEDAQRTLPTATLMQLSHLEFKDWGPEGSNRIGAWHRMVFPEFEVDFLLQISNARARLGCFEGLCFLDEDSSRFYSPPAGHQKTCTHLGSLHLQLITDEFLEALGISPESAIAAIKWQMR